MESKLVKYEQRLKTNRERFINKNMKELFYNRNYIILVIEIYNQLTKKTKLKIKQTK